MFVAAQFITSRKRLRPPYLPPSFFLSLSHPPACFLLSLSTQVPLLSGEVGWAQQAQGTMVLTSYLCPVELHG